MNHRKTPLRRLAAALLLALALCTECLAAVPAYLIPGGNAVGIKLYAGGLLITALDDGAPAQKAGLRAGDTIIEVNGDAVQTAKDLTDRVQDGQPLVVRVQRGAKQAEYLLSPAKQGSVYRLGAHIRDNIAGIGTVTFYDPETGVCGALGHGVNDLGGTNLLRTTGGILVSARVAGVVKSTRGTPGELKGDFDVSSRIGLVSQNEAHGIFGRLLRAPQHEAVPVASAAQVHTGKAVILANVDGSSVQEYCVRIDKLYPQAKNGRNLLLTVTDERLLEKTGGIVQGMSGSPILQDGRLVGAVTHVLVNHPEQGYGVLMETMLAQCDSYK